MMIVVEKCLNCGIKHEWEFDAPHLKELRIIKKLTNLKGTQFAEAMADEDPDALAALLYILHLRDKIKIPFDDVDLDLRMIDMHETEAEKQERERLEAEANKQGKATKRKSGQTSAED